MRNYNERETKSYSDDSKRKGNGQPQDIFNNSNITPT